MRSTFPAPTLLPALFVCLLVAGCGNATDTANSGMPPVCPETATLVEAAQINTFTPGGNDLRHLVLSGHIGPNAISGFCQQWPHDVLRVRLRVAMSFEQGPAATSARASVPFFVALTRDLTILDKRIYSATVTFPNGTDQLNYLSPPIRFDLAVPAGSSGAAYQIRVGFQLTQSELNANRQELGP